MYLLLASVICFGALVVCVTRPDLRGVVVRAGWVGAVIEAVSEAWYLQDYWQPLTLLPWPTPEDLLYGFGVTALAACAVPFWLNCQYEPSQDANRKWGLATTLALGFGLTMTTAERFHLVPSIWVATLIFLVFGLVACLLRRDLWWAGATAGGIMGIVTLIGYGAGLNFVIDGGPFLNRVLLIAGTHWDIRVLGNIPLDEIAWNVTRGWCIATLYPLLTAQRLVRRPWK